MDCIFCKIAQKEIPATFLYEDAEIFAIHDIHPKAPIHVLVIPKEHIESAHVIESAQEQKTGRLMRVAANVADTLGIGDRGYKLVVNVGKEGGQVIPHLHMHMLGGKQHGEM